MAFQPTLADAGSAPVTNTTTALARRIGVTLILLAGAAAASALDLAGEATTVDTGESEAPSDEAAGPVEAQAVATVAATTATAGATAVPIDVLTTRSGAWQLAGLPAQGDAAVYRMTLDRNPAFVREFACRPLATKEAGRGVELDLQMVSLLGVEATVAQGACRVVQNMQPVSPNLEWVKGAVAARVIPAYRRERAWVDAFKPLARDPKRGAYDPRSLGPRTDGAATAPTSSHNFVGVTSAQGGEYASSRGFLHDADARVVDAALHSEQGAIEAYWPEFEQYTLYSLAQPQGAAWSTTGHITVDPQFPQDGDRGWEVAFHNNPNPAIDSAQTVTGWTRDVAHLENSGFIHWVATEDPIAGLLVQRQAAYALAARYEYLRGGYTGTRTPAASAYAGNDEQERGLFNTLSALWKSRYVSRRVNSMEGRMFWSPTRAQSQADQVIAYYDQAASRVAAATVTTPADYVARLSGTPFTKLGIGSFVQADGSTARLQQTSAFEAVQYGKEPLWLWSRGGHTTVRRWFTAYATGLAARMAVIGGTMGVDGRKSTTGSGYPTGPTSVVNGKLVAVTPDFASAAGWAEWVAALPLRADARDSFDGAAVHTAMQMEGALLMAQDAGLQVPQIEPALSRLRSGKAATTSYKYASLQMLKHMGAP
ncbi:MAG: hypothetical protein Q7J32_06035 [Sphingomonadaceae bacterium]|nr:hypothetical protein [Sphingomonadaceae bacterium]